MSVDIRELKKQGTKFYPQTHKQAVVGLSDELNTKSDKASTVSTVTYDGTNKKITKTINGTTTDVVTVATIKSDLELTKSDVSLGNVTNDAQVKRTEMGVASGVATLDSSGKVPSSQLPGFVDDVVEGYLYNTKFYEEDTHTTEITGEGGKIYIDLSTNKEYRWSGSVFSVISETIAIGTTTGTALDGKTGNDHIINTSNPHSVTKSQVGLGNVDNKSAATLKTEIMTAANINSALGTGNGTTKFFREDGTWQEPAYPVEVGDVIATVG